MRTDDLSNLCAGLRFSSARQAIGDGVEQPGLSETTPVVVDDDSPLAMPLVAHEDLLVWQIDRRFIAGSLKAERVVLLDRARRLGIEQFVSVLGGRKEPDARLGSAKK